MNKKISLIIISFMCAGLVVAQETSDREKQNQISYLFKMGTECYYQGKYSQAIKYWEAVLDIDPQQTQPPALIENAREQIQKESSPLYDQLKASIEKGNYMEAQEYNLKLLDLDATNKEYKESMNKLKKIVTIFPSLPKNAQVARLIKQGVYSYLVKPIDIELSTLSLRQALQITPEEKSISQFYTLLKNEYPAETKKQAGIDGVNILDQLLRSALNYIYQGQYVEAITECNRALRLDPDNTLALKRLGSAYFALGNKKTAFDIWGKALKIAPNDEELKKFLKSK